jgi:hypothetical protein
VPTDHLERWVAQLRTTDPRFAEASRHAPAADRAWQAAVYLLTGSPDLWAHFGPSAVRTGTLDAAVTEALAVYGYTPDRDRTGTVAPSRYWRPQETDLLVWAAFCWTDTWFEGPTVVPRALSTPLYERWLTALWLHKDHDDRPAGLLR